MGNDFNTANAITTIFKVTKIINNLIRSKDTSVSDLQDALKALKDMLWVLGIEPDVAPLSNEDKELVISWNKAKAEKDFEKADKLRSEISERNIIL